MGQTCSKLDGKKSYHPVCVLRSADGRPWIVCTDRLIPSRSNTNTPHHTAILGGVAQILFPHANVRDIGYKPQQGIQLGPKNTVFLDYSLRTRTPQKTGRSKVVLEIQGGGESSATGEVTRHVATWATMNAPTNGFLRENFKQVGIIPNNAWKRQLEQIFRKTAICRRFDAGFALVMGDVLYDYVTNILGAGEQYFDNWEISLISIAERASDMAGSIPIDQVNRSSFFSFDAFIEAMKNFPLPDTMPNPFNGHFTTITNENFDIGVDEIEPVPVVVSDDELIDDSVIDAEGGAVVNNPDPETSYK
jgi:hypothetical protein